MSGDAPDRKAASIFEVVSAFMCNTLYTDLYNTAKDSMKSRGSLTDSYLECTRLYVNGLRTDKSQYVRLVQDLREYFRSVTSYATLTFSETVDRILSVCVPRDYYEAMTSDDKDTLLSTLLVGLAGDLVEFVSRPENLRRIIDNREADVRVTLRLIQDASVTALTAWKSDFTNRFLGKSVQSRDMVPRRSAEKMFAALRDMRERAEAAEDELERVKAKLHDSEDRFEKLRAMVALMRIASVKGEDAAGRLLSGSRGRDERDERGRKARRSEREQDRRSEDGGGDADTEEDSRGDYDERDERGDSDEQEEHDERDKHGRARDEGGDRGNHGRRGGDSDRSGRDSRGGDGERSERGNHGRRGGDGERDDRGGDGERSERDGRGGRGGNGDRSERDARGGRGGDGDRSENLRANSLERDARGGRGGDSGRDGDGDRARRRSSSAGGRDGAESDEARDPEQGSGREEKQNVLASLLDNSREL